MISPGSWELHPSWRNKTAPPSCQNGEIHYALFRLMPSFCAWVVWIIRPWNETIWHMDAIYSILWRRYMYYLGGRSLKALSVFFPNRRTKAGWLPFLRRRWAQFRGWNQYKRKRYLNIITYSDLSFSNRLHCIMIWLWECHRHCLIAV